MSGDLDIIFQFGTVLIICCQLKTFFMPPLGGQGPLDGLCAFQHVFFTIFTYLQTCFFKMRHFIRI